MRTGRRRRGARRTGGTVCHTRAARSRAHRSPGRRAAGTGMSVMALALYARASRRSRERGGCGGPARPRIAVVRQTRAPDTHARQGRSCLDVRGSCGRNSDAEVTIVGGGAIGCAVAYALIRASHRDIQVVEQDQSPASDVQAAGLVGQVRGDQGSGACWPSRSSRRTPGSAGDRIPGGLAADREHRASPMTAQAAAERLAAVARSARLEGSSLLTAARWPGCARC